MRNTFSIVQNPVRGHNHPLAIVQWEFEPMGDIRGTIVMTGTEAVVTKELLKFGVHAITEEPHKRALVERWKLELLEINGEFWYGLSGQGARSFATRYNENVGGWEVLWVRHRRIIGKPWEYLEDVIEFCKYAEERKDDRPQDIRHLIKKMENSTQIVWSKQNFIWSTR